jgi:hypothetical protein
MQYPPHPSYVDAHLLHAVPHASTLLDTDLPPDVSAAIGVIADSKHFVLCLAANVFKIQNTACTEHMMAGECERTRGVAYPRHLGWLLLRRGMGETWRAVAAFDVEVPAPDLDVDAYAIPVDEAVVTDGTREKMRMHQSKRDPLCVMYDADRTIADMLGSDIPPDAIVRGVVMDAVEGSGGLSARCRQLLGDGRGSTVLGMLRKRQNAISCAHGREEEWKEWFAAYHNDDLVRRRVARSAHAVDALVAVFPYCKVIVKSSTALDAVRTYCARRRRRTLSSFTGNVVDVALYDLVSRKLYGTARMMDAYERMLTAAPPCFADIDDRMKRVLDLPRNGLPKTHPVSKAVAVFTVAYNIGKALMAHIDAVKCTDETFTVVSCGSD